jgi:lipopolysaccharide/colanic/teichoic acid biosynthesis glycosyltransferase/glycosyltransferase involved in cell wall biosynthesis
MRVAVVHDWLVVYGGAERVLEHILDCYPEADLYSLIDFVPQAQRHFLRGKTPRTSFVQNIPGARRHYPKMLPILPLAIEQFDLSSYDLIISSSYCVAKGVLTGPNQIHVCYCHSPMRYAWDHYHEYLRESKLERGPKSWFARWQLHKIRTWDARSSNTVDAFISNSKFVQARIYKFYRRESVVVYPPIETGLFKLQETKENFYVAAGRFVPFKRLDLAVDAFARMPDKRLIMIGDGPEMQKLRAKATPNVEFFGFQPAAVMRRYLSRARAFIFPSEEDFGIVPVEAQACGTPVIAFGSGGALETIRPLSADRSGKGPTGVFFDAQTPESLMAAVHTFEQHEAEFDPVAISQFAAEFSPAVFRRRLVEEVDAALENRKYAVYRAPSLVNLPLALPRERIAKAIPDAPEMPQDMDGHDAAWALRVDGRFSRAWAAVTARLRHHAPQRAAATAPSLKRVIDILGASLLMVALVPLGLLVAFAIRLESRGSPLFSQKRVGTGGRIFTMYKFRSMRIGAEGKLSEMALQNEMAGGVTFKMRNDPRVTGIGRVIRRTSIDELPQLYNVFMGDMSLVGPRPALPSEVAQYNSYELGRLHAVPGLTCIWQVSGRSSIPFKGQVEMDLDYVHGQSAKRDLRLLFKTIAALLRKNGAH